MPPLRLTPLTSLLPRPLTRTLHTCPHALASSTDTPASNSGPWSGRQPSEHATNRTDELDVQSSASKSGARQRAEDSQRSGSGGEEVASSATSERDPGNQNEQAKKDHPEAPGPVIGMNDERGGKGYT